LNELHPRLGAEGLPAGISGPGPVFQARLQPNLLHRTKPSLGMRKPVVKDFFVRCTKTGDLGSIKKQTSK
jgi:hypothetical protein